MGNTTAHSIFQIAEFIRLKSPGTEVKHPADLLPRPAQAAVRRLGPAAWVDYGLYIEVMRGGARALGMEDEEFCRQFGEYQVEVDTPLLYKTAARLGGPGIMIMGAERLWRRYHDSGTFKVLDAVPGRVRGRIEGLQGDGPLLCQVLSGFIRKGLVLCGVSRVVVVHNLCRFRGDGCCEFTGTWEEKAGK